VSLEEQIEDIWGVVRIDDWTVSSADQEYLKNYSQQQSRDPRAVWLCKVDRTEALIKQDLAAALISTSSYVRRYAELLSKE
jgi:hypothetical protein